VHKNSTNFSPCFSIFFFYNDILQNSLKRKERLLDKKKKNQIFSYRQNISKITASKKEIEIQAFI